MAKSKKTVELHGKVKGTKRLRLRKEPSLEAEVLMLLENEELLIDSKGANNSTEAFYKVCVLGLDGKVCNEGYVMKDYVETFKVTKSEPVPAEETPMEEVKEPEGE